MPTLFLVTRILSEGNDYFGEDNSSESTQTVGIFATRAEAQIVKEELDGWPDYASGVSHDIRQDEDGHYVTGYTINWWKSARPCHIREIELGTVYAQPYDQAEVDHAIRQREERKREHQEYKEQQEKENALCIFFDDHGADRHFDYLSLYLVEAGCETLEDVLALGAEEFVRKDRVRTHLNSRSFTSESDITQGLRDFQRAIERQDFKMSAKHARHRQPGGWHAGPVAGYDVEPHEPKFVWNQYATKDDERDLPF